MLFWNGILSSARNNIQTKLQKVFISVKNAASMDLCLNIPVVCVCVCVCTHRWSFLMTLILSSILFIVDHASVSFPFLNYLNSKPLFFFFPPKHQSRVILLLTGISTTQIQVQIKGEYKEDTHHPEEKHKRT